MDFSEPFKCAQLCLKTQLFGEIVSVLSETVSDNISNIAQRPYGRAGYTICGPGLVELLSWCCFFISLPHLLSQRSMAHSKGYGAPICNDIF